MQDSCLRGDLSSVDNNSKTTPFYGRFYIIFFKSLVNHFNKANI